MLVVDEYQVSMAAMWSGQGWGVGLGEGWRADASAYLKPIRPTSKFIMSTISFESPPLGAFDRVMVLGSTVLGRLFMSCAGVGS